MNPFKGLPVPPQPGIDRRDSRPTTAQGTSPPSRPPTRGSAAGGGSNTAQGRNSGPSAPRRPSAKRAVNGEGSNSAQAGSSTQSAAATIPPRHPSPLLGSPTHTTSDLHSSGPDGKSQKRRPPKKHKPKPKPRRPYVRIADREKVVTEPAKNTRQQRERVEFGFGDLDRLERRRREERKAERERAKKRES